MSDFSREPTSPEENLSERTRQRELRGNIADLLMGRGSFWLALAVGLLLLAWPWIGANGFWLHEIPVIGIYVLLASGLNLTLGFAGELQFSQVAMFALGAYITGVLATHGFNHAPLLLLASGFGAALLGLIISIPAVRLGGWALAMVSFFLVLLVPDVVQDLSRWTGGYSDLFGVPLPTLFGHTLGLRAFYVAVTLVVFVWIVLFRNLTKSRYAQMLRTMRESPDLASTLGLSVRWMKIWSYMLGSFPAGVAGCLFCYSAEVVSPTEFTFSVGIVILAASLLGGAESVYGAVVGAAIMELGPLHTASFQEYSDLAFGIFIILVAVLLRQGLAGIGLNVLRRLATLVDGVQVPDAGVRSPSRRSRDVPDVTAVKLAGRDLIVKDVIKRFGGLTALNGVSLKCKSGQVTGLVGTNGSGKTTLLNIISGLNRRDAGTVVFGDVILSNRSPEKAAVSCHLARTFQTPIIPRGMTVLEAVETGCYHLQRCGMAASMLRLPRYWSAKRHDADRARAWLNLVGISDDDLARDASSMPIGTRRLIELARAMAGNPGLVLLDEPASGLAPAEVTGLGQLIRLAATMGSTIIIVEHNFGFVLNLADNIYVLELGEIIASGPPSAIRTDRRVISSYLGEEAAITV